jgi:hypothetical protein
MHVTALYAGLLAPTFLYLSLRVIKGRRSGRKALGHEGNDALLRRVRAHGNFAEYVPYTLLLIGLAENVGTATWLLHLSGLSLLLGRVLHAYGVSQEPEKFWYRVNGMKMTFASITSAGLYCVIGALR